MPQWIKANWPKEACWDMDGLLGEAGALSLTGWQLPHAVEKKHRRHEDARPQTRCDSGLAGGAERIRGSLETLAAGMVLTDQRHMHAAS
ncbi:hypothetical protein CATMQ487_10290 [Sphaerotilus microaerophilus]|uniref:Uncharacterized protein n=1 Tax=Sphaerotilus microaerophilus TaxID=2914710 RepID=A0ABN6PGB1_9BURK|nr:hypothetical protein CATMQ487_10290 [Sphaerotilus sp. FB-5]